MVSLQANVNTPSPPQNFLTVVPEIEPNKILLPETAQHVKLLYPKSDPDMPPNFIRLVCKHDMLSLPSKPGSVSPVNSRSLNLNPGSFSGYYLPSISWIRDLSTSFPLSNSSSHSAVMINTVLLLKPPPLRPGTSSFRSSKPSRISVRRFCSLRM